MESEDDVMEVKPKVKMEYSSSPPPKSNVVANLAQPRTPKVTRVQSPKASLLSRSDTPKANRSSTPNKSTPPHQNIIPSPSTPLSLPSTSVTPSKSSASGSSQGQSVFAKEIRHMMYGLGDHKTPYKESVDLVEQLVLRFVAQLVTKAQEVGNRSGGKVAIEDIVFVLRKDRAKFARVRELLTVNDELKKAKKAIADFDSIPAT